MELIPSVVDGLTIRKRKILYAAMKMPISSKGVTVARFGNYVSEKMAYHDDGGQQVNDAILCMALGAGNINLLHPIGSVNLEKTDELKIRPAFLNKFIFLDDDEPYLEFMAQDLEPTRFYPIIPMVLVNGYEIIGTDLTSFIPQYDPNDIINNLRRLLNKEEMVPMEPCYRWFQRRNENQQGEYMAHAMSPQELSEMMLKKTLKLCCRDKMNLLVADGSVKKYNTPEEIILDFFSVRLEVYKKKKEDLVSVLKKEVAQLGSKITFLNEVANGTICLNNKRKEDLCAELEAAGYVPATPAVGDMGTEYDYLLSMNYMSAFADTSAMLAEHKSKEDQYKRMTAETLWLQDLIVLQKNIDRYNAIQRREENRKRKAQETR